MYKKKRRKKMIIIILVVLLSAWLYVAQFMMKDRISESYARKIFTERDVALTSASIKINGRNIHYAKTGTDTLPSIVFIHGSPGSWSAFMRYLYDKDLLMKYRLVAVDRPGFGYSDFGNTLNLQKQSILISSLLQSLSNGKPIHLVGHSSGGPLIVKIAADHPELVSSLVILAGAVDPSLEKKEYWRPVITYTPLRWLVPSAMRYSNEELWYLKNDLKELAGDFTKVTCPVQIFHGDKDNLVPVTNIEYARKMLKHSTSLETTIFPGANHFIVWSKYSEIKDALLRLNND